MKYRDIRFTAEAILFLGVAAYALFLPSPAVAPPDSAQMFRQAIEGDSLRLAPEERPQLIEKPEYILYLPSHSGSVSAPHPLVVALSPVADAWSMLQEWRSTAEKRGWIIYASKTVRNGVFMDQLMDVLVPSIRAVIAEYPIDKSKVIATGLSGGGMTAHFLIYQHPELITAAVINTGMMCVVGADNACAESTTYEDMVRNELSQSPRYPRNKIAVFLASPTDFRYEQMKRDRLFLGNLGWKTKWIEFKGGHTLAPHETVDQAAEWLATIL